MRKISILGRLLIKWRFFLIPDGPHGDRSRGKAYKPYLRSCGRNFKIASNAFIFNPAGLTVGDNVYIGFNSYIGQGDVTLKDEVLIGNFVSITASNHLRKGDSYRFGGFVMKPIVIGKGTWIAAHSSVTAGSVIEGGCLIAAGSVVNKSFTESNVILAGVPAKIVKILE
jgi:maltose O-acetyltransferase